MSVSSGGGAGGSSTAACTCTYRMHRVSGVDDLCVSAPSLSYWQAVGKVVTPLHSLIL